MLSSSSWLHAVQSLGMDVLLRHHGCMRSFAAEESRAAAWFKSHALHEQWEALRSSSSAVQSISIRLCAQLVGANRGCKATYWVTAAARRCTIIPQQPGPYVQLATAVTACTCVACWSAVTVDSTAVEGHIAGALQQQPCKQ